MHAPFEVRAHFGGGTTATVVRLSRLISRRGVCLLLCHTVDDISGQFIEH